MTSSQTVKQTQQIQVEQPNKVQPKQQQQQQKHIRLVQVSKNLLGQFNNNLYCMNNIFCSEILIGNNLYYLETIFFHTSFVPLKSKASL